MIAKRRVVVAVPVFNKVDLTVRFLESFQHVRHRNYVIVIGDDGSTDGTARVLARRYPNVIRFEGDGNRWWSGATNLGVRYALEHGFDYVLTINNDAQVDPEFLSRLVKTAEAHPRSIVGSRLNFLDQPTKVWAAGGFMNWTKGQIFELHDQGAEERELLQLHASPRPVEILTGCGTLVPTACYREVGLYDEVRFPQYHGDSELVLRAGKKGWRALVDLDAVVWNDVSDATSVNCTVNTLYDLLFSKKSSLYLRSIVAIHGAYCPRTLLFTSFALHYFWRYWYSFWQHPVGATVKHGIRGVLRKAA